MAVAVRAVEAQAARATARGARFHGDHEVAEIVDRNGRVAGVRTVAGEVFDADVVYQTRIQKERFADPADFGRARGDTRIDARVMERLPEGAIVMHPLPRVDEIHPEVDADPRAAYFRQARNGLFIRMALLDMVLS